MPVPAAAAAERTRNRSGRVSECKRTHKKEKAPLKQGVREPITKAQRAGGPAAFHNCHHFLILSVAGGSYS